jgi:hypothetical protein
MMEVGDAQSDMVAAVPQPPPPMALASYSTALSSSPLVATPLVASAALAKVGRYELGMGAT